MMNIDDDLSTLEGEYLRSLGDNQAFQEECYYFGTVHAIVDLMRLYGFDVVMKDINRVMSEWDDDR
jgi:hypothetical protein